MPYDLFISYSRKDNVNNRVTELKEKIESEYLEFTNEELKCFFDKDEITGMDDWKHRLLGGLKDSDLLLLILSPHYIDSPYCEWEIVEYLKYEYSRATQGEGVAQIYFMEIPGLDEPGFKEKAKAWLEKVSRRQRFDFREWYDEGSDALKRTDVKNRLDELKKSLQLRITRMRRIVKAPGNLPAPNTRFVGREREMKLLHEYVGLGKFGVLTAVHGMGGLGKTAIAFQYAYTYADFYPGGRWQIGCANETNLAAVLKKLDLDLKVTFTEDEKKDDIRGAKRIINELEILAVKGAEARAGEKNPPKPAVLLLLDNVDHAELIQPPNSDLISGKEWLKILVTTRMGQEELGEDETMLSMLTIDELPFEDAVSLIESYQPNGRFKDENEKEKAGEIVKLLGRFTLAVEVAALYLNERRGRTTCTQLIEILKTKGVDFVGENTIKQLSHTKLISATLSPTLDTLSPEETMILNYASLLPSDSIPIPWLKALAIKEYPELGEEEMPGLDNPWISNINQLLSLRLLQIVELDEEGRNPRIVRMHRIVQETIQKRCDNKDELLQKLCDYALSRSEYLEENWYKKTEQWEINPLVNFTEYLLGRLHPTATRMVKYIGQWLGYIYSYYKYKELHLKAIEQLKNNPSSEQTEIAILLSNLSVVTQNLGNLIEAEKLLKTAIEIDEKYRERTHPFLSIRYSNIATLEIDLGNLKDAKEYLMKAIEIDEKNSDQDKTTRDYISLGTLEQDLGNFKEAKELFLKALQLVANSNEPEHAKFAMCYSKLASVENDIGNLMEAKEFIKKALQICDKNIESVHPDFAKSYSALASTEKALGNLKNSKELRYKALEIDEAIYESGHPNIAKDFNNLAIIEDDLGNFKEAKELYLKAIEIYEKLFEPWHPDLASLYSNLASVEKKLGNLKEAEVLYRKTSI
jgi:tetratricopeptide (TPR) repeat protein